MITNNHQSIVDQLEVKMNSQSERNCQFNATKFWNKLVKTFTKRMICKTHRKGMKTYENCFSANQAITHLHEILLELARADATRSQAKSLLRKFLLMKIIEDVKGRNGHESLNDNRQLYRFSQTAKRRRSLSTPNRIKNMEIRILNQEKGKQLKRKVQRSIFLP